jgi:cell division transport system ATP-binding protein
MIVFDHVTKKYGNGTVALDDICFALGEGEFVVVEGKSGAGKSTLGKAMIKEVTIDAGKIVIDGDDLAAIPTKNIPLLRRKVGTIFQDFKLLPDRTVAENVDLALDIAGISVEIGAKRRRDLLDLTGILDKEDHFPVQLSGGELQRVAIARALAAEPKILFADEPTGNLDAETGWSIVTLLKDINAQGTTILMATHDLELIKDLPLRRLRLDHGRLVHESGHPHHKKHE